MEQNNLHFELSVDSRSGDKYFDHSSWDIYFLHRNSKSSFWESAYEQNMGKIIYLLFPAVQFSHFPFYVGKSAGNFKDRLNNHKKIGTKTNVFQKVMILKPKSYIDADLNTYFEKRLIDDLYEIEKIPLVNSDNNIAKPKTNKQKEKYWASKYEELKLIINACLPIALFKKESFSDLISKQINVSVEHSKETAQFSSFSPLSSQNSEKNNSQWSDYFEISKENSYFAKARFVIPHHNDEKIKKVEVLAGSWVKTAYWDQLLLKTKSKERVEKYHKKSIDKIKSTPTIWKENDKYILSENLIFNSPSGAAMFFVPRDINWRSVWKKIDENGKKITLEKYLEQIKNY